MKTLLLLVTTLSFSFSAFATIPIFVKNKKYVSHHFVSGKEYKAFVQNSLSNALAKFKDNIPYNEDVMYLDTVVFGLSTDLRVGLGPINTSFSKGMEFHYKYNLNAKELQ
jgi:hypothetical protein